LCAITGDPLVTMAAHAGNNARVYHGSNYGVNT
jgi:hypothetical protein